MNEIAEFFNSSTTKEWIFLLIGAVLGYLTNWIFYLKGQNSSSEKNLDRIFDLYNKTLDKPDNIALLQEIKQELGNKNTLDQIHNEIVQVKAKLDTHFVEEDVVRYKILGNQWSAEYIKNVEPSILTNEGRLHFENILEFHKSIFPGDFPWAGKFRDHEVIITDSFTTMAASKFEGLVNYNLKPVNHVRILPLLHQYCLDWNKNLATISEKSINERVQLIAKQFHDFLVIHPFADGNGRVARILLLDMTQLFLGQKFSFQFDRQEYYVALRVADMGNMEELENFIKSNLKNLN